jgi:hypothetical protein
MPVVLDRDGQHDRLAVIRVPQAGRCHQQDSLRIVRALLRNGGTRYDSQDRANERSRRLNELHLCGPLPVSTALAEPLFRRSESIADRRYGDDEALSELLKTRACPC